MCSTCKSKFVLKTRVKWAEGELRYGRLLVGNHWGYCFRIIGVDRFSCGERNDN